MKAYTEVKVPLHLIVMLALVGDGWLSSWLHHCSHWIRGWVGPRAGLNTLRLTLTGNQSPILRRSLSMN